MACLKEDPSCHRLSPQVMRSETNEQVSLVWVSYHDGLGVSAAGYTSIQHVKEIKSPEGEKGVIVQQDCSAEGEVMWGVKGYEFDFGFELEAEVEEHMTDQPEESAVMNVSPEIRSG